MIRIYDKKRNFRISNNVEYTTNPLLFNLNDWVIVGRNQVQVDNKLHPYVYITKYDELTVYDQQYEIIICNNQDQLRELLSHNLVNKVVYVLHGMSDSQIENAKPALVINTFNQENQIKVNHRNLFVTGSNLGYSLQINRLFYYETYAFLKLKLQHNSVIYISSEIECSELYTNIGINQPIDISAMEKVDNNVVEFTISDRFNKYLVTSNLVLDFDKLDLKPMLQQDFRLNYLKFDRKAYLSISGIRTSGEFKQISGKPQLIEPGKTNQLMIQGDDLLLKSKDSQAQVLLRNYINEAPLFMTNIKRQKYAEAIDNSTRLIIIYDPNDRGFVNVIDRTNAFEIAINKLFTFDELAAFAIEYALQVGIEQSNIIYVIDDSVIGSRACADTGSNQIYLTSSLSIKNSIRYCNQQFNFTNIKMSQIAITKPQIFLTGFGFDQLNNNYFITIPDRFKAANLFIKLDDSPITYEAINPKQNQIILHHTFFTEVLNQTGDVEIQIIAIENNQVYCSNTYYLIIDDEIVRPNYDLAPMCIYTVIDQIDYTSKYLPVINQKFAQATVKIIKYNQNPEYELFIKNEYNRSDLSLDEYICLYPLYLKAQGFKYFSYIASGTIYSKQALMLENDSSLCKIRAVFGVENQIYIPEKINYMTMAIVDYIHLLNDLTKYQVSGVDVPIATVESANDNSTAIDFIHQFNPWDKDNLHQFVQLSTAGTFLNAELIELLKPYTALPIYPIPLSALISRNNRLLNIGRRQMKLSIIITTYCNQDAIYDTLHYIVDNIGLVPRDFEILIFDDCSADGTIDEVHRFFASYPHINNTVRVNERNMRYPGYGANCGIRIARGKYVHIVDGDDKVINNIYGILNRAAIDEDVISFGHYNYDVSRGEYIQGRYYSFNEFTDVYPYEKSKAEFKMLQANVTHWNKFFKTSFLRENHLYYLENQLVQDSAFLTDVYYCKPSIRHIPEIGYIYHIGQESVSSGRKGYKLFIDFVNANMKRTPLVDSFFPQYTYTMKRFMIYDEINDQELESIVDLLADKYSSNYRITDIEFFNKGQLLYKMMHTLLVNRDYAKIRQFLKYTEEFKLSSGYLDSKYYDLFLGINKQNVIGHFIVNVRIFANLFAVDMNQDVIDQFVMYYTTVASQIENELVQINALYAENSPLYTRYYAYILDRFELALATIAKFKLDLVPIKYQLYKPAVSKTKAKIIIIKNPNKYLLKQLERIDPDVKIYEIAGSDEQIAAKLRLIHDHYKAQQVFCLILEGSTDFDFNNLYLIYNAAYSTMYSLICLTGEEEDDMFRISNRYLINIGHYSAQQFSSLSVFKANQQLKRTVKIEITPGMRIFEHISIVTSGYGNVDTENMELLNKLYHTSQALRSVDYEERKQANMHLFDFNVVEG